MIDIPDSVFSQDEEGRLLCPKCKKTIETCTCPSLEPPKQKPPKFKAHVRIEKSGRGGKIVTLVEGLPKNESFLKDLAKTLKAKAGSGGTFYIADEWGVVEIQGDKRELIQGIIKGLS